VRKGVPIAEYLTIYFSKVTLVIGSLFFVPAPVPPASAPYLSQLHQCHALGRSESRVASRLKPRAR
jgi:hypothetical protein